MESPKKLNHRPVKIIEYKNNLNPEILLKKLNLNEHGISKIFKEAGDRPVSIIAMAGPLQKGKSFILDYLVAYLEALDGNINCDFDYKDTPLTGFSWQASDNKEAGIFMWSKPFIIKVNNKEIAVILMDTQGTYVEQEKLSIIGLSIFTSSYLILNICENQQENIFRLFDSYTDYGKLVMGENINYQGTNKLDFVETTKPFQKLLLLVLDWNKPQQFPYGSKGGNAYLKKNLEIKKKLSSSEKKIRKIIPQCFSEMECFLLPELGEYINQQELMHQLFCQKIKELIHELLSPDELNLKTIFGNDVHAVDMLNYFKQYVELFKDGIPSSNSLMEATSKMSNENFVQLILRKYVETMKKRQRGKGFISSVVLLRVHKFTMEEALHIWEIAKKFGPKEIIESYKDDLIFKIKEKFDNIESDNSDSKKKFMEKEIEDCLTSFRDSMLIKYEDNETFIEPKKFESILNKEKSFLTSDLKEKLDECNEKELIEAEDKFLQKLEREVVKLTEGNSERKVAAEKKITEIIKNSCQIYKEKINGLLENAPFMSEDELAQHDLRTREDCLSYHKKLPKVGTVEFQKLYILQLNQEIDKTFDEIKKNHLKNLEDKEKDAKCFMDEAIFNLMATLRLELNLGSNQTQAGLDKIEADIVEKAKSFKEQVQIPTDTKFGQKLENTFVTRLQSSFQSVVSEMLIKKQCDESYQKTIEECLVMYNIEIEEFIENTFQNVDELKEKSIELKEKALETLETFHKKSSHENPSYYAEKLEKEINKVFENATYHHQQKMEKCRAQVLNLVHDVHNQYQQKMLINLDEAYDEDDFCDKHNDEKEKAMNNLKNNFASKNDDFLKPFVEKLSNYIDSTYNDELLEVFDLKLMERKNVTVVAVSEARKFYKEEMEKHYKNSEFMRPKDLLDLDMNMSKLAIEKCVEKIQLTEIQIKDLKLALKQTFNKYKYENDANVPVDPAIGIDLGTTYSCVAVYLNGSVKIIPNSEGKNITPSYVCYDEKGKAKCGTPAKEKAYVNAENTVYDAKRIIGRKFDDPEIQNDMKYWTFKVVDVQHVPKIEINQQLIFPEEVSSKILKKMRKCAEKYLNCNVKNAVITVPAYFTDGQRQATIDAGVLAGLNVLSILTEPVSAAIAYKLQHSDDDIKHVLIFDLGGGTFDVSILKLSKGNIETLGVNGDTHLGGQDFDQNVMKYCAIEFQREHGIDLMKGKDSSNEKEKSYCRHRLIRLKLECERRKIDLASCRSVDIAVDGIHNENGVSTDLLVTLTRAKFEEINRYFFEKTLKIVEKCLQDTNIDKSQIDDIVLVGGSSRIPKVQKLLTEYFEGRALIRTINPDEAVAYGAAVQAAVINGQIAQKSIDYNKIQDVSPMAIGIEIVGCIFSEIIPKNTKIPAKFNKKYVTVHKNQTKIRVTVYQGEAKKADENNWLGEFMINNIPPADAGKESIDILMEINLQGILHVTAVCTSTGCKDSIRVTENKRRLDKEQINRILKEDVRGSAYK